MAHASVQVSSTATTAAGLQERFAAGSDRALDECHDRFGPLLESHARRYVGVDDAQDVVQTAMVEAWRLRDRYDPRRPLEAWLLTIVRRRAIDLLRTRKPTVALDAVQEPAGDDGRDSAERFAWAADVRQALHQLPEAQREAIVLSYFGGLSQTEIAARIGTPLGTVKTRTARGLSRLAELLGSPTLA